MNPPSSLLSSMGVNITEYSQALSIEKVSAEFDWASEKIKLLITLLKSLPNCNRVADIGCRSGGQAAYYRDQAGIREMHSRGNGRLLLPQIITIAPKPLRHVDESTSGNSA